MESAARQSASSKALAPVETNSEGKKRDIPGVSDCPAFTARHSWFSNQPFARSVVIRCSWSSRIAPKSDGEEISILSKSAKRANHIWSFASELSPVLDRSAHRSRGSSATIGGVEDQILRRVVLIFFAGSLVASLRTSR